jgi:hypothetical protein
MIVVVANGNRIVTFSHKVLTTRPEEEEKVPNG